MHAMAYYLDKITSQYCRDLYVILTKKYNSVSSINWFILCPSLGETSSCSFCLDEAEIKIIIFKTKLIVFNAIL